MEIHTHTHTHAVLLCTRPKGTIFYNKKNFIVPVFSSGRRWLAAPWGCSAVTCHPCLATPTTLNAQMTGKPQLSGFS
jgi:hypothetical protein